MSETTTTAALGEALAQFQSKVGAVPRSKEVTVTTKSGGSYKFKYAPHEAIVEAIRGPLSEAGLSVSQHLSSLPDGIPALRTVLLHKSGERIEDTFPLPTNDHMTAQELGSAITYIRRYALSAILGLATDDDDDGNHASGNAATFRPAPAHLPPREGSLIGVAEAAKAPHDFELRQTPDGPSLGFALKEGREIVRVLTYGPLAEHIAAFREAVEGKRVTCFGTMSAESWTVGKGTAKEREVPYTRLVCTHLTGPDGLALPMPAEAPSVPMFDEDAERELDAALL